MDLAYDISKFIIDTRFTDLPQDAIDIAKKDILDIFGVSLAGSSHQVIEKMRGLAKNWGGKEEGSVLVFGDKFPLPNTVLINSTMANALDYDDTHERGGIHAGCVVIPTALALSEQKGDISGIEFLTAVCLGIELGCRIGMAAIPRKPLLRGGWTYPTLHGYFSAAAVAGRILGLDADKIHDALGLAYHQAAGNMQAHHDGAEVKMMGPGFASRGGVTAALMSQSGISGTRHVFDGAQLSFYNVYHAGCNREVFLNGLGYKFEMYDMGFKPYPSCRASHHYIDVVINLARENDIQPEEVEEVIIHTCKEVHTLCTPEEVKRKPENPVAAQFSLPWILACAIQRREVGLGEFNPEALRDNALIAMAAKVHPVLDASLTNKEAPAKVSIKTKKGTLETNTGYPFGSLKNPMTFEDIEHKLMDCATASVKTISEQNLIKVVSMVKTLEHVENVKDFITLLT